MAGCLEAEARERREALIVSIKVILACCLRLLRTKGRGISMDDLVTQITDVVAPSK
jgi:hypothetical protein